MTILLGSVVADLVPHGVRGPREVCDAGLGHGG
jgi:hypothetical protein